ncbi:MAG TPA: DinB family protein [Puia sp.]
MDPIRQLYSRVDDTVSIFLRTFQEKMESLITGTHDAMGKGSASPIQLFTHVLTHEFHHKRQVMSMCRLLGHQPPDTDVSNLFSF